jgi:hypothetical protein
MKIPMILYKCRDAMCASLATRSLAYLPLPKFLGVSYDLSESGLAKNTAYHA